MELSKWQLGLATGTLTLFCPHLRSVNAQIAKEFRLVAHDIDNTIPLN